MVGRGRELHAETAQSSLTVIFKLVIGGLTSVIFVVLDTVNLQFQGFPHSSVGKKSACNAGDLGSIPGSGSGQMILQLSSYNLRDTMNLSIFYLSIPF